MTLAEFIDELKSRYFGIHIESNDSDSGAVLLRIYYKNRYYVSAVDLPKGVWLDEPEETDGLTSSFRYRFFDLSSAAKMLNGMIATPDTLGTKAETSNLSNAEKPHTFAL